MRSDLWSLDEYVVVADLYLRRGRSSGISDPEVVKLAQLTGRSPASISRRLGNFDGTARPGNGLKPVSGDALRAFEQMRASTEIRAQMTLAAERRLSSGALAASEGEAGGPRLVDPENHRGDPIEVSTAAQVRQVERVEAELVRRYRTWLDPDGTRLRGLVIPVDGSLLRVDLFDPQRNLLIEAKAATSRNHLRQAVGQLLDYRRYLSPRPVLAILVPLEPSQDLVRLPHELGIDLIWEEYGGFTHSTSGSPTSGGGVRPPASSESRPEAQPERQR
jgi:hypothetical protein